MNAYNSPCCGESGPIDFSKMTFPLPLIDWDDSNFWWATAWIIFNPLFWNVMGRLEHKHRMISSLFGSAEVGCAGLGCLVFLLGLYRDWRFLTALGSQPKWELMKQNWILWSGHTAVILGFIFVITSLTYLGFSACYMGDYFLLWSERGPGSAPYTILYVASSAMFFGAALIAANQAGLVLSWLVCCVYVADCSVQIPYVKYIWERETICQEDAGDLDPSATDKEASEEDVTESKKRL